MNIKMATGFALRNIKANKHLNLPFIISTGVMLALFNIMASLQSNHYVLTRHRQLTFIIQFGIVISFIFSFVFVLYANGFLMKKRNKELALYTVLGLHKRHIGRIILVEHIFNYLSITFITISGGYIFGKLAFVGLNRMLKDISGRVTDYPFSFIAMKITLIYILFLFLFVYALNIITISKATTTELLGMEHSAESEPKNRYVLLITGLGLLLAGYTLALKIEGTLESLIYFFLAAILVALASYFLFISLSIFILKMQKKNKSYFYKAHNFLSVSGMLYRMKSGSMGLASLCILSTGVIITVAVTLCIYGNIETMVKQRTDNRYFNVTGTVVEKNIEQMDKKEAHMLTLVKKSAKDENNIKNYLRQERMIAFATKDNENRLTSVIWEDTKKSKSLYLAFTTIETYNARHGTEFSLADGEILLSSNSDKYLPNGNIMLGDTVYKTTIVKNNNLGAVGIGAYEIVLPDRESLFKMSRIYKWYDLVNKKYEDSNIEMKLAFDIENIGKEEFSAAMREEIKAESKTGDEISFISSEEFRKDYYGMNGGFLFLGVVIAVLFLSGTILITYYKQLSEGLEDRAKYQVMKNVGLPDELIKKTGNIQVIWMFFLPLMVAFLHCLVASKIVYQLLGLFGVNDYFYYGIRLLGVSLVFAAIYFLNFKITSDVYYRYVR